MKDLYNYMTESLLDIDDVHNKLNASTIKKEVNTWIKTHMKKRVGRITISPKPNEDGQFIISYDKPGNLLEIDFSDIPNYVLFDIDLGDDEKGGVLSINNANNISVLSKFKKFKAQSIELKESTCTLDSPLEKSSIKTLYLLGRDLSVELGDMSNVELETVIVSYENCTNLSPLKNVKGFKNLHLSTTQGSVYNLNGLKGEFLKIGRCQKTDDSTTLTGKFDFNSVSIEMLSEVNGLPSNMNKLKDTWGNSLLTVKSVQEFVFGPWIDDIADQILTRLHAGSLKIKTVTHYQAPYEEIPYDEFITKLRMRYVKHAVLGNMNQSKGHWDRISIDLDKFQTWAKSAKKYEVVRSSGYFPGKMYIILKDGAPIGAYIEDNGGYQGWASVNDNVLCTSDKQLMEEMVKL